MVNLNTRNKSGIYKIVNLANGKFYIGSAINLQTRKNHHLSYLRLNKHHNPKLQAAFNKYGEENFVFEIIEEVGNVEDLICREQFWIDHLNIIENGYNICPIAGNSLGRKCSEETKQKLSKINTGKKRSIAFCQKTSIAMKGANHPNYGKFGRKISDKTRHLMSTVKRLTNTSGFPGVSWNEALEKYKATVTLNGKRYHLGYFESAEEANNIRIIFLQNQTMRD